MARQESYQGLARKWRPQRFEDLVGQEAVAQSFQSALRQGRVVHGHLLAGPRGVGKTTSARILAKALNCEQGPTPTPCGVCRHCIDIAAGNDMDVIEIDAASNTGVDNIRELRERVNNAPFSARYKVYIIDEIHMLSTSAFNALLKTLEEPPPQVIFVFATTELEKVPETIRSRCVQHTFRRMSADDIARRLEQVATGEKVEATAAELREIFALIARAVEGGMRDALVAFDQLIAMTEGKPTVEAATRLMGLAEQSILTQTIDWLVEHKAAEVLRLIEELSERGRSLERFAKSLVATLRDLMILQTTDNEELVSLTGEALAAAREQSRRIPSAALFNMLNQLFELEGRLKQSTQTRFLVEFALLRIASVRPVVPLDEILQKVQALPEAAFSAPPAPAKAPEPPARPAQRAAAKDINPIGPISPITPIPAMMNDSASALAEPPVSAPSGPLAGLDKKDLLETILPQLPESYRGFMSRYLESAAEMRVEGSELRIEWTPDTRFSRKMVEKPENTTALERVLSAICGAAMRVVNLDADPSSTPPPPEPPRHSMWVNSEQVESGPAPLPRDEPGEDDPTLSGGEDENALGGPPAFFGMEPPAAEDQGRNARATPEPADIRSPLQKAQDLIRSSEDAGRRIKLLQEMLGGRLIDDSGQPLPA